MKTLLSHLSSVWMASSRVTAHSPSGSKLPSMTCFMDAQTKSRKLHWTTTWPELILHQREDAFPFTPALSPTAAPERDNTYSTAFIVNGCFKR